MRTAVDSNILIDIREGKSTATLEAFRKAASQSALCICPVVYAEAGSRFSSKSDLDSFLQELDVAMEGFSDTAAYEAGQVFLRYKKAGGERNGILPDFFIGSHAAVQAQRLLTRDRGFYRQYFRGLTVIEP